MEVPKPISKLVGFILLAFGLALAALLALAVMRSWDARSALGWVILSATTVDAFLLLLGYRLVFNRPYRDGSLLSPLSWRVVATCFSALAVVFGFEAVRENFTAVFPALGAALMAYLSVLAARRIRLRRAPSQVFPPDTSLIHREGFIPEGFRHGVEILNDDRTPMEFVVTVLQENLDMNRSEAIRTMLDIHRNGGALVSKESVEESIRVAAAVNAETRRANHPLICRAVSLGGVNVDGANGVT